MRDPPVRSADVYMGASGWVWLGSAEDFAGDGGHLSYAEEQVAQQV